MFQGAGKQPKTALLSLVNNNITATSGRTNHRFIAATSPDKTSTAVHRRDERKWAVCSSYVQSGWFHFASIFFVISEIICCRWPSSDRASRCILGDPIRTHSLLRSVCKHKLYFRLLGRDVRLLSLRLACRKLKREGEI